MLKLFLGKSKELNNTELPVMMALNGLQCGKHDYLFTSISEIAYTMTGLWIDKRGNDRRLYNGIKEALSSLGNRKIITVLDQNGENYILSNEGLEVDSDKEKFIVVELWEMQKIFSEVNRPFNVFTFFVNLVGTINNTTKEWHMSQDEMAAQWSCSKRTVNDYLEQLEHMQLIYVYRHKKRRKDGTYYKLNNSYGRYCDKDAIIAEAQKYADTVECEDVFEKLDRRAIKLRYNAYCNDAKKYKNDPDAVIALYRECVRYNKSLKSKPVEGVYDGEWKQGELLDLSVFPDEVRNEADDNWGEPIDFSIEEMFDMPVMDDEISEQNNIADNESHDNSNHGIFCVTGNDLDLIDIDDLF